MARYARIVALLLLLALLAVPLGLSDRFVLAIATQALIWALLAASWDLLAGYTGQASFGHAGFFLMGGYGAVILSKNFGWSSWLCLPIGMAVAATSGLCVALPALRLSGHYLAIVTLAFAELVQLTANNWTDLTGGSFGLQDFGTFDGLPRDPLAYDRAVYLVVLVIVAVSVAIMWLLCERSRAGEAFRATREDPVLAQALGINTTFYKTLAFAVSSAFAGLAGGLYSYEIGLLGPSAGTATTSAMVIGMAVFGGLGTIWGPAVGGLVLFLANEALRFVGLVYNLVTIGVIIMAFVILVPSGIAGWLLRPPPRRRRGDVARGAGALATDAVPEQEIS
jgi:branched-chain amino acid transport system permease protein